MSPPPPPPPAYNISSEYAAVADVPVTLAVDPRKITQLNIPKKSCKPDDIVRREFGFKPFMLLTFS